MMTTCSHNVKAPKSKLDAKAIDRLAKRQQFELTDIRRQVLEILAGAARPVGAYELMSRIQLETGKPMTPPTIYRTLDFLISHRVVAKIESQKAFILTPQGSEDGNQLFLICRCCGTGQEVTAAGLADMIAAASTSAGFALERQTVEVSGLCRSCQDPAQ